MFSSQVQVSDPAANVRAVLEAHQQQNEQVMALMEALAHQRAMHAQHMDALIAVLHQNLQQQRQIGEAILQALQAPRTTRALFDDRGNVTGSISEVGG